MFYIIEFFDGAFGTYYFEKTGNSSPCELANLENPDLVLEIHKEYINAGANSIKTNTFGATPQFYADEELLWSIIAQGYSLAQSAVLGTDVRVYADIGSIYSTKLLFEDAEEHYLRVADIFIKLGATNFIFETAYEFDVIKSAISHIKSEVKDALIIVSFAVSQDGYSRKGIYYSTLIAQAELNPNVDVIGLNCLCGPAHLASLAKKLSDISKPISIMPNAGYPSTLNGRTVFQDNADYFAAVIAKIHRLGINILGGCCGTTPKHIERSISAVMLGDEQKSEEQISVPNVGQDTKKCQNKLALKPLKPLLVELDPPVNDDCEFILRAADKLKSCGVTTITLTDSPLAKVRADSVLTAAKIKTLKNIDVLPHITCRDKNRLAIKGSLLGASFFGINKVLIVTGDPVCDSNYKNSGVFDFNSRQLISYIKSLNEEVFSKAGFLIGGAINLNAQNFESELKRCKQKNENGAEFLLTQPIFTDYAVENLTIAKKQLKCKIYAGILPVASYRNALFLNNEVSGIEIPQHILDSLKNKEIDEVEEISINFSRAIIEKVYDYSDGFYIMTPLRKVDLVTRLIRRCFDV